MIGALLSVGTAQKVQAQEPHPPPPTPKIKNYLNMAPGEIQYFVGGTGTGVGYIGTDWEDNSVLMPDIDVITNYIAQSALQERVLLLKRFTPVNGQGGSSTSTPVTLSTSTSGHFKILALRYSNADGTRPTGKSSILVTLNARAKSFAYPPSGFPTAYPVLPDGTSHKASLQTQIGTTSKAGENPSQSQPSSEVGMEGKQLITLDWDQASKCEGEDDIYAIEVDTQSVQASATATIEGEGFYANPQVNAWADAQTDNRNVSLSRAGAHDEWYEGDVKHGDTVYSHWIKALNGTQADRNTQHFNAGFGGDWTARTFYSYDNGVPEAYEVKGDSHEWSPESDVDKFQNSWNSASYVMPYGSMDEWIWGWDGAPTGQTEKQITYTVKDNRNNEGEITAEPKYVLHLHDPLEVSYETTEAVNVNVILYNGDGQSIVTPDDPNGVKSGDVTVGTGTSSSTGWSVGSSLDPSFIAGFLKFLKLDLKYNVTNSETVATTARLGFDLQPGEKAYAMITHEYTRHHTYAYKYDEGGRNVRKGRGAMDGNEDPNELKEVPHEIFADEGPTSVSPPFWMGPIGATEVPPTTPNTLPPFHSTYTS